MACELKFALDSPVVGTTTPTNQVNPAQIIVSGTVTDCEQVIVQLVGVSGDFTSPELEASIVNDTWTVTFLPSYHYPKDIPCGTAIKVLVRCEGDDSCKLEETFPIACRPDDDSVCPSLSLIDYFPGEECTNSIVGGYRDLHFTLEVDWTNATVDEIQIQVRAYPVEDPNFDSEATITATPAQATYTQADLSDDVLLLTGYEHAGSVSITSPDTCNAQIEIPPFAVPDCDCDTPPIDFLTVALPDNTPVEDPNNTCVEATHVIVTAPGWAGQLEWSASDGEQAVTTTPVSGQPRSVRVDLPADGTRILITAEVGIGDCIDTRVVSAERCAEDTDDECQAVPDSYALVVQDKDGNPVTRDDCIEGESVTVIAPPFDGGVIWLVNGQPPSNNQIDPDDPRRLHITMPQSGDSVTVTATVGEDECATAVSRTLRPCECPEVTGLVVTGCARGSVTLTAQGSNLGAATSFTWEFGDGSTGTSTTPSTTHNYANPGPFEATVVVSGPDGCDDGKQTATVPTCTTPPPPQLDFCWPWLIANFVLMGITAIAIFIAACLFNPVIVATGPAATWLVVVFWVALVVAIVAGIASIISFIAWMIVCGSKPNWCPIVVWIRDIFATIAAASAIIGLILIFIPNAWSCGMGLLIDGGYFALLAWITDLIARSAGCPIERNGLIGILIGFLPSSSS